MTLVWCRKEVSDARQIVENEDLLVFEVGKVLGTLSDLCSSFGRSLSMVWGLSPYSAAIFVWASRGWGSTSNMRCPSVQLLEMTSMLDTMPQEWIT